MRNFNYYCLYVINQKNRNSKKFNFSLKMLVLNDFIDKINIFKTLKIIIRKTKINKY